MSETNEAPDRTSWAVVSLRISAVLYVVVGLLLATVPFSFEPGEPEIELRSRLTWGLALFSILLGPACEWIARALRRRRRWAWKTGIVLFLFYLPSAFLPLGIAGLYGLLAAGSRSQFPQPWRATVSRHA